MNNFVQIKTTSYLKTIAAGVNYKQLKTNKNAQHWLNKRKNERGNDMNAKKI